MSVDPLETWSARVADGEAVDWEAARAALDETAFRHLRQLAELAGTLRSAPEPDPAQRRHWGHLEIRESLGRGSFGQVLLAFDSILKREVALKLMRTDVPGVEPERWIEEAQQLARVRHPNVLAVHGADLRDGIPGLWADRIEGETLRDHVQHARPSPRQALDLARQLADAVVAVHASGLVHGDLKPSNVMVERGGRVVLMDFGTAGPQGRTEGSAGSPAVMSPERLAGGPPTRQDDIHALGAVFLFVLSGRYPYPAETLEDLEQAHRQRARIRLSSAGVPRAWRRLLRAMLDPDPERRPDIDAVIAQLDRLHTAPARRRRAAALGSIFALLVVGLAISVTAYVRVSEAESETSAVNDLLSDLLVAPRDTEMGRETRIVEVLERAVPEAERRFADRPRALATVRGLVGRTLQSLGEIEAAETELRAALASQTALLGEVHPRNLLLVDSIAWIERQTGRVEQADASWDRVLAEADPDTVEGRQALILAHVGKATLHSDAVRLEAALAELDQAMTLHRDGRTDRAAQRARMSRGLVLVRAGRLDEALVVNRESLEASLRLNGPRHRNTVIARDRLLQVHHGLGAFEQAEQLARENLEVTLDWLGPEDRLTVMSEISLSIQLAEQGRSEESLALLDAAAEGARIAFRDEPVQRLSIDLNRAARLLELARFDEAEALASNLQPRLEAVAEQTGGLSFINGLNLAEARYWLGDFEAASRQAERMHSELVATVGEAHPLARIAQSYRAAALLPLGRVEEAERLLQEARDGLVDALGTDHIQVLLIDAWLAEGQARAGDADGASRAFDAVFERAERVLGADHYRMRDLRRIAEGALGAP